MHACSRADCSNAAQLLSGRMIRARTKVYFDGGCRPNPGPMETAVVLHGVSDIRTGLAIGDSNAAEWLALIHAAEVAIAAGLEDMVFVGDSLPVINQASGLSKCRSPELRILQARFRALVPGLPRMGLRHVPRSRNLAGIALARRHSGLD